MVRGLCVAPDGESFFSCGDDQTIKHWALGVSKQDIDEEPEVSKAMNPVRGFIDEYDNKHIHMSLS